MIKKTARTRTVIFMAVIVLIILCFLALLFVPMTCNKMILKGLEKDFEKSIEEFDREIKIVETKATYGNLNGNGNKIGYFVAVLAQKDSVENIEDLMASLDKNFDAVEYCDQYSAVVRSKYLERGFLEYEFDVSQNEYVSIILYTSHTGSNMLDINGH